MKLAPRFLVNFCAALKVALFARRQKALGRGGVAQAAAFAARMADTAGTEFASLHGLKADTPYAYFRDKVRPRTHDWFEPFIRRMAGGERDVLVRGQCSLFVETAGAGGTAPKLLPLPEAMLAHFRAGLRDTLCHYACRAGHARVFGGRHVQVGASTKLREETGTRRTSLDGILALCLGSPTQARDNVTARARATSQRDITLVAGTPAEVCAFVLATHEPGNGEPGRPPKVWPNLECCLHTGATLGLWGDPLRAALGSSVKLHDTYAAAAGIFAAQDAGTPHALRVLADSGIFFEFLPRAACQEDDLVKAGPQCLTLDRIETGIDYVPVVTTPAGLVRYVTGDIVRFVTTNPPRLQFVGRTAFELNAQGEHVDEREVLDTLQAVCTRNGWQPIAFHVAPYSREIGPGQLAHLHEWWLELGTHTMKTPTANVLGPEFDAELSHRNPHYAGRRASGSLGAPVVRLVMPGVFQKWASGQNKTASASKLPRCRPDRLIADQLAALAPFHQATIPPFSPSP